MFKKLTKAITVVKGGITYNLSAGDTVEPDEYGIPAKYFEAEHADKMVRSQVKKDAEE